MVRIIASNPSLPLRPEGQIEQERLPDIFERDMEEYVDATDFVDPVSSFSGPVAQYYLDDYKEKNSLESRSSRNHHSILGYDDHYGSSEIEEEWEVLDLPAVGGTATNTDNFNSNHQQQFSQRGKKSLGLSGCLLSSDLWVGGGLVDEKLGLHNFTKDREATFILTL